MQLVLLHALPLDGSMWGGVRDVLPDNTLTPTLYQLGDTMQKWATAVLELTTDDQLVVVGCSIGGSCALEVAALAGDRVRAVVLIGAKSGHRPQPELRDEAIHLLRTQGSNAAWSALWGPLFARSTPPTVIERARTIMLTQSVDDIVRGVDVFHSRRDLDHWTARWRRPLIVLSGAEDTSPLPATAARTVALAAQGEHYIVPNCGHYVPLEQPHQVRAALQRMIDEHSATA